MRPWLAHHIRLRYASDVFTNKRANCRPRPAFKRCCCFRQTTDSARRIVLPLTLDCQSVFPTPVSRAFLDLQAIHPGLVVCYGFRTGWLWSSSCRHPYAAWCNQQSSKHKNSIVLIKQADVVISLQHVSGKYFHDLDHPRSSHVVALSAQQDDYQQQARIYICVANIVTDLAGKSAGRQSGRY